MLFAFQGGDHFVHQVVDVQEFEFHGGVVHGERQIVGDGVAERGHGAVVVGPAPFAEQVRETVDQHLGAGFFAVFEEQFLPCLLAAAVFAVAEAAGQARLLAAAEHHRAGIVVLFEVAEQRRSKAEVALHEL